MTWRQISVVTDKQHASAVADLFSDLGALSVTYLDAEDEPVYEPAIGEIRVWSATQIVALYELDADDEHIKSALLAHFSSDTLQDWKVEQIGDQPWELAWMEHYQPMKFGHRLWVCPTDQERHEQDTVCLILDPGLAFGTGTHPTTALCLEWLASQELAGKTVIDYGCGSGILAIAAILLGASVAHAVDIDPQALTATQMNAAKNSIQNNVHCYLPEQFQRSPIQADIVLANILANPLMDMVQDIVNLVKPGGKLVLSGILAEQAVSVQAAYRPLLALSDQAQQEDWVRLTGRLG